MPDLKYFTGFGNEFATEAVPGGLPVGQNAPQKAPLGLYTEQLSGSPFTAPRLLNRRTLTYRIRPSVMHKPYERIANGLVRSTPFNEVETTPSQLRWDPLPLPTKPPDSFDLPPTPPGKTKKEKISKFKTEPRGPQSIATAAMA